MRKSSPKADLKRKRENLDPGARSKSRPRGLRAVLNLNDHSTHLQGGSALIRSPETAKKAGGGHGSSRSDTLEAAVDGSSCGYLYKEGVS